MHQHKSSWEKHWLPSLNDHLLRPHPYCESCGTVKNISSDCAEKLGHYINVLSEMKRHFERKRKKAFTGVQMRLIIKELQGIKDFEDAYWMRYSVQRELFLDAVCKYTSFSRGLAEGFL